MQPPKCFAAKSPLSPWWPWLLQAGIWAGRPEGVQESYRLILLKVQRMRLKVGVFLIWIYRVAPGSCYSSEFAKHSVYSALLLINDCMILLEQLEACFSTFCVFPTRSGCSSPARGEGRVSPSPC